MTSFDPSTDFLTIVDGLQCVTLQRPNGRQATVGHALRRAIATHEAAASDGCYTSGDVRWHLPQSECPIAPRLGDALVDPAGGRWVVLGVEEGTLAARWECACRNLAIVHRLDEVVTIERAVCAKGAGGAALADWRTWRSGVRARIQPAATEVQTHDQAWRTRRQYQIFVAEELLLDHTHRVKGPDGTLYRVTGYTAAQRLGQLQTITAEVLVP